MQFRMVWLAMAATIIIGFPTSPGAEPARDESSSGSTAPVEPMTASSEESDQPSPLRSLAAVRERLGFGAILRSDYYSASKRLNDEHNLVGLTFQPKLQPKLSESVDIKAEGRLYDEDVFDHRGSRDRLLEAYLNVHDPQVDLRLGQQIIAWGRADAINPTDLLTPKDFTHLSAEDEVDRRFGLPAGMANFHVAHALDFSVVWIPIFHSSVVPIPERLPFVLVREEPNHDFRNHSLGFKLDRAGTGIDWSLSYFQGFDLIPFGRVTGPQQVLLGNQRIRAFGGDLATTLGRYGVRAETAYVRTDDPHGLDPLARNPSWTTVAGIDSDLTENFNVNLQGYTRVVFHFQDPFQVSDPFARMIAVFNANIGNQLDRLQTGVTGRLKATWLQKTLAGELLGVFNANRTDFFVRPMLSYALTDVWKVYVGGDIFNGRSDSFFGRLQNTSAVFVELRAIL